MSHVDHRPPQRCEKCGGRMVLWLPGLPGLERESPGQAQWICSDCGATRTTRDEKGSVKTLRRGIRASVALWLTAAVLAIGACANSKSDARDAADSQPVVSNSPTSSGWSDAEVLAYARAVAMTLVTDAPTVEKRVRSAALRSFARRVIFQHKQIADRADSLMQRQVDVPAAGAVTLRRHVDEMKRLASQRDFDLQYVKLVRLTLRDAQARIEGSNYASRGDGMRQLLDYMVSAMRAEASNARKIEAALMERRAQPPATKRR